MKKTYWFKTESGDLIKSRALTLGDAERSARKIQMNCGSGPLQVVLIVG